MENESEVISLGGGVYVEFLPNGQGANVMANSHTDPTDTVWLDRYAMTALVEKWQEIKDAA